MKTNLDRFQFIILWNTDSYTFQIGDINTKSVLSVTLLGITIDSKVSNIRKSQNFSLFGDRKSICLLSVTLGVLLKKGYAKSWKGTINIKLYKWCITITRLYMMNS